MTLAHEISTTVTYLIICHYTDPPIPVGLRAEATADNTSIRLSWEWSYQGVSMCVDFVRVDYQPEGGSLMMYTVDNTTATNATLSNLQCNTEYTIWVYARGGQINRTSSLGMVSLPARGRHLQHITISQAVINLYYCITLAPPTPTEVTAQSTGPSTVRVSWQWTSSGPAPSCFNTTTVTYRPEGGDESSLQLSDPAATDTTLTNLQCNTNYTITVVATTGEHRSESVATTVYLPLQGMWHAWGWSHEGVLMCVDLVRVHYRLLTLTVYQLYLYTSVLPSSSHWCPC